MNPKKRRLLSVTVELQMPVQEKKDLAVVKKLQRRIFWLNIPEDSVLVASTGVIGQQIPIEKIKKGIENMAPLLSESISAGTLAAEAIMTTDTVKKEIAVEVEIGGKERNRWRNV